MYDVDLAEQLFSVTITDRNPDEDILAQPYEKYFSEGGAHSVRHLGKGSRIREKVNAEERAI
jgi:hypothetical protein